MSKLAPLIYRTTNWRAYSAALKQRRSLPIWFDPDMEWLAASTGKCGRPATFLDAAIQTCLMPKVAVWFASEADNGAGCESSEAGKAELVRARPQHALPSPKGPDSQDPLLPQCRGAAPSDRQHRHQGGRRVEHPQAWRLTARVVTQGAPGHGYGRHGGPGHRDHGQPGR